MGIMTIPAHLTYRKPHRAHRDPRSSRPFVQRYRITEQLGDAEPHQLFTRRNDMLFDEAFELLEARMRFYDTYPGYSVLEGHEPTYFDVWQQGVRVALVRIEEVQS